MAHTQNLHALLDQTGWIHAMARSLVADPHLAADLAQETALDALEVRPDGSRPLRGWLATVMRHRLARFVRGEGNRAAREEAVRRPDREPAALEVVERAETHRNVVLAVLALAEPYRSTLLMRYFEQLSYDEIARRTGVTRAAVNSRITRGLGELRSRLEHTYGGDRRALFTALTPLAKLPTGVAATSTLLGLNSMHLVIGTAAATLLTVTISVFALSGEPETKTAFVPEVGAAEPAQRKEVQLAAPQQLLPAAESAEDARAALPAEAEQRSEPESAEQDWQTELFHVRAIPGTVESIALNSGSGDVEVRASASGKLEVEAKVRAKLDKVESRQLTQVFEDHVSITEEDGVLIVEDAHKNSRGWTVSLVVSVPGNYPLAANSGSGDVVLRVGAEKVHANSGSGDVRVELAQERVQSLKANSGSGAVVIEVASIEGDLSANSGSGDVTVRVAAPTSPGSAGLNSGSGSVRLIVPGNFVGSLDLETHGSAIVLPDAFGMRVEKDVSGRLRSRAVLGGGGGKYKLSSGSGDLAVSIGTALPAKRE